MKKKIDVAQVWSKESLNEIPATEYLDKANWILEKRLLVGSEWYQVFVNVEGARFNWLLKLWSFINISKNP